MSQTSPFVYFKPHGNSMSDSKQLSSYKKVWDDHDRMSGSKKSNSSGNNGIDVDDNQSKASKRRKQLYTGGRSMLGGVPLLPSTTVPSHEAEIQDISIELSVSQKYVIDLIMRRKSVFFSGAAGSGKSFLLKVLQDIMSHLGKSNKIAFTAPTGIAACNIRGMTIHSWSGIGLGNDLLEKIVGVVKNNRDARNRWLECEILVIDEISMLSSKLFDMLSKVGSRVRNNEAPFGGIQVILCGDFFQVRLD